MCRVPVLLLAALTLCTLAAAQPSADTSITFAGTVTATPALELGSERALADDSLATALTFAVKTAGEGTITVSFDHPRTVSAVRFYQGSTVYYLTAYALEMDATGDGRFQPLAGGQDSPVDRWVEQSFAPVKLRALRLRSLAGQSGGARAHPCLAELQIIGQPEVSDMAKAAQQGVVLPAVPTVRPLTRNTPLVVGGRGPAVLAPQAPEYAAARAALLAGLAPYQPEAVTTVEAADPGHRTVVCLGSMLTNPLLSRLYWNRYTFIDALTPGKGNYLLHTVYDPYPWGGGNNVIVLGCSAAAGAGPAVQAFLAALTEGTLPYLVQGGPQPLLSEAEAAKVAAAKLNPTYEELTSNANAYLKTGCEAYARRAVAALRTMAGLYAPDGERRKAGADRHSVLPWNEETTSFAIACAWDAFEECPLIDDALRLAATNALLQFTRDLVGNVSDWNGISEAGTVAWNHTTFPLLGVYSGARYFARYYTLADMPEKLRKARQCFLAQARAYKPQEDSDAYLTYVPDHTAQYCLSEHELEHFTGGQRQAFGDYLVGILDNRGLGSGFGDSGLSATPREALDSLPLTLWWTRDPGYKWLLNQYSGGTWQDPFDTGVKPERPTRFLGVKRFALDPRLYEYTQATPSYNEPLVRAEVPPEQAFDKLTFRDEWDPYKQYLLLDGLGRGKHLHYDTNAIIEFVEGDERWLVDHDYLTRNTTEHNMLTVLRNGRGDSLVPSLAGLSSLTDLHGFGASETYVKGYNGCDWQRQILWRRGEYFLVADTVTAREAGDYDLELTFKTLDYAGEQRVSGGDFVAERGAGAARTQGCMLTDDQAASGGKALVMEQAASRLAFGLDLPDDLYSLTISGYGLDTSSDSLWVSVDLQPNLAFHLPKGAYGGSTGDAANTAATPQVRLQGAGPHLVIITLRESPPVRVDRFVFRSSRGVETVLEAESLPPAPRPTKDLSRYLHIRSAEPVTAWVTNHERQGISAPISILHQRRSAALAPGDSLRFASVIYTSWPETRREVRPVPVAENLLALQGKEPALAVLGPVEVPGLRVRAASGLLTPTELSFGGLRRLELAGLRLQADRPIDISFHRRSAIGPHVVASAETSLTVTQGEDEVHLQLQAGTQNGLMREPDYSACEALIRRLAEGAKATGAAPRAAAAAAPQRPLFAAFAPDSALAAVKVVDLGLGAGSCALVVRGSLVHCLDAAGRQLWQAQCGGRVRDVAVGDLRPRPGLEVVAGCSDAYVYVFAADGTPLDRYEMRGTPWARSFGDSAYAVYNVGAWDINGDGQTEILATLKNFDLQARTADGKLLWKHDYALHGSMQMSFESTGRGKPDTIFLGNKYGSVVGVNGQGKAVHQAYTSIGDVFYAVGDVDGDGKPEVVNASSTGDLMVSKLGSSQPLWHFDNFGYPANRVRMADLNGDGRQEVLLASGTGYLYALDGSGKVLWQDRAGFCVNDVVVASPGGRTLVACCDESGLVRVRDGAGAPVRDLPQPAPARLLAVLPGAQGQVLLVGLADGRLLGYAL